MSGSVNHSGPEDHHHTGTHSSGNQNHLPSTVRGGIGSVATPANRPYSSGFGPKVGSTYRFLYAVFR